MPTKTLELHYPIIQFLINRVRPRNKCYPRSDHSELFDMASSSDDNICLNAFAVLEVRKETAFFT